MLRHTLLAAALTVAACSATGAQQSQPAAHLVIDADLGRDTINRNIYGQFAEHLGRGIYDGLWTRSAGGEWHLRDDVIEALKKLHVPNVRWPGGCFADRYHWQDGIGPRDKRPTIVNTMWGNVTEDNSFGTHEYMELVQRLGAAPFVVGNVGSGSVREMAEWWEYVNFPGRSPMGDLRRANGRSEPWNVRLWGVGNESWGCGGSMTPEHYADVYKNFATFLASYGPGTARAFRVATGPNTDDYRWTEVVMREAGSMIDGLDLHYYTVVGSWSHKGSATQFTVREWFNAFQKADRMEELVTRHAAIMDRYDPRKRVALVVGEWGMWHDAEPGTNPGFLYQQNSLRDALVAAVTLDVFNRHADRVRMANIAQFVNVLQSMILTKGDSMALTPTYHVFEMYTVHQDAVRLPLTLDPGTYELEGQSVPAISASASRDGQGRVHVTLTNIDPNGARTIDADIRGVRVTQVTGRILTAPAMNSYNDFAHPDVVRPVEFRGATVSGGTLHVVLPPHSVVVLELK
ncbi:MAG TPA: alpha-L-arabinofuranosidase C-terminal domain-containing protein [Gemmatimonadaceae bacterium]|nr:alpha-L-arabinofuranosidase C-terminal domain-containing protein [Gemmatimonadaceae bacterium]